MAPAYQWASLPFSIPQSFLFLCRWPPYCTQPSNQDNEQMGWFMFHVLVFVSHSHYQSLDQWPAGETEAPTFNCPELAFSALSDPRTTLCCCWIQRPTCLHYMKTFNDLLMPKGESYSFLRDTQNHGRRIKLFGGFIYLVVGLEEVLFCYYCHIILIIKQAICTCLTP